MGTAEGGWECDPGSSHSQPEARQLPEAKGTPCGVTEWTAAHAATHFLRPALLPAPSPTHPASWAPAAAGTHQRAEEGCAQGTVAAAAAAMWPETWPHRGPEPRAWGGVARTHLRFPVLENGSMHSSLDRMRWEKSFFSGSRKPAGRKQQTVTGAPGPGGSRPWRGATAGHWLLPPFWRDRHPHGPLLTQRVLGARSGDSGPNAAWDCGDRRQQMALGRAPPGGTGTCPRRAAESPPWVRHTARVGSHAPAAGEQRGDRAPQRLL